MTGKRGPAVLPIGVRQHSVYQRKTLLEKCRQRTASVPAISFAGRGHMEDICSAGGIEHVRASEEARKGLAIPAVAGETEAGVRRHAVSDAAHLAAPVAKRQSIRGHRRSLVDLKGDVGR